MFEIIVRFPNKELAEKFCGQMSDGFGEDFCNFLPACKEDEGYKQEFVDEKPVYSVDWIDV